MVYSGFSMPIVVEGVFRLSTLVQRDIFSCPFSRGRVTRAIFNDVAVPFAHLFPAGVA